MAAVARKRESKNIRTSSTTEKLDEIFNNFVDGMKPFVLKLAKKTGNFLLYTSYNNMNSQKLSGCFKSEIFPLAAINVRETSRHGHKYLFLSGEPRFH